MCRTTGITVRIARWWDGNVDDGSVAIRVGSGKAFRGGEVDRREELSVSAGRRLCDGRSCAPCEIAIINA
jgi:hypothetical protein